MGHINQEHIKTIESYLDNQGLTFIPLRDDMIDHFIMDLESHIDQGNTFDEAWNKISNDIPSNHFKTLQIETMEAINKRFNISKGFTYLSIFLLTITSVFKLLHLPGTTILLFSSLAAIGVSLLVSSLSGVFLYREKRGVVLMMGTIGGVLLFLLSWVFQILQLPGATPLKIISIIVLLVLFPALIIYFNSNLKSEDNILTYLHHKHTPGIERFLFIILFLATILKFASIIFGYPPNVSRVLLILVISAAGLQYFALTWHPQSQIKNNNNWTLGVIIIAFVCFIIPSLGSQLSLPIRAVLVSGFYMIAGFISISRPTESINKTVMMILILIISTFYVFWLLIQLSIIDASLNASIFNLPVLFIFFGGLVISKKLSLLRTYMIIVIAHYLFEFPNQLGLW